MACCSLVALLSFQAVTTSVQCAYTYTVCPTWVAPAFVCMQCEEHAQGTFVQVDRQRDIGQMSTKWVEKGRLLLLVKPNSQKGAGDGMS